VEFFLEGPDKNNAGAESVREHYKPRYTCSYAWHIERATHPIHPDPVGWSGATSIPIRQLGTSTDHADQLLKMIHTTEFKAMGCRIFAAIDNPNESAPVELEDLPNWFESLEQSLSRFRPESE